jgi:hypothetical protein
VIAPFVLLRETVVGPGNKPGLDDEYDHGTLVGLAVSDPVPPVPVPLTPLLKVTGIVKVPVPVLTVNVVERAVCAWLKPFKLTVRVADCEDETEPEVPPVWAHVAHVTGEAASVKVIGVALVVDRVTPTAVESP